MLKEKMFNSQCEVRKLLNKHIWWGIYIPIHLCFLEWNDEIQYHLRCCCHSVGDFQFFIINNIIIEYNKLEKSNYPRLFEMVWETSQNDELKRHFFHWGHNCVDLTLCHSGKSYLKEFGCKSFDRIWPHDHFIW